VVLRSGDALGAYTIQSLAGVGGMGEVYRAHDARLDRLVAIKVLRRGVTDEAAKERFFREARSLAKLRHANVVAVFDVGEHDGMPFLVMELVEGPTLATLIHEQRDLALVTRIQYAIDVCDGLAHAHDRGIIHRDVKPGNILVDEGRARLVDFGIARPSDDGATTAAVTGSPNYLAPEQVLGAVDRRSDLYALAATLFELITGEKAFPGSIADGVLYRILNAPAPELPPSLRGSGLGAVIGRALEKDPARRFQSAIELKEALTRLLADAPSVAPVVAPQVVSPVVTLRRRLIQAVAPVEIARLKYEVDEYLAREPHDVEGRLLADEIARTIGVMPPAARSPSPDAAARGASWRRWSVHASMLAVAVVAVSVVLIRRPGGPGDSAAIRDGARAVATAPSPTGLAPAAQADSIMDRSMAPLAEDDVTAIRGVIERFERAQAARDAAGVRAVWPDVDMQELAASHAEFLRGDYAVSIRAIRPSDPAGEALVDAVVRQGPEGSPEFRPASFRLRKSDDGWSIVAVNVASPDRSPQ
jgi:serine/threonine-protein kinase